MPPSADQLLAQLAQLLNTRMRLHELGRTAVTHHAETQRCSNELDAMLERFHRANGTLVVHSRDLEPGATGRRSLSVITDGLAD